MASDRVVCPECGAEFKAGRLACPECGSDAQTGWQDEDEIQYQSVEIPDYLPGDLAEGAAGAGGTAVRRDRWLRVVAVLAILALVAWMVARYWRP